MGCHRRPANHRAAARTAGPTTAVGGGSFAVAGQTPGGTTIDGSVAWRCSL